MKRLLALMITMLPATALAQSAQDKATATTLFEEGKTLLAAGKYDAACPKFAAAQRLAPTLGRKLNLADCYRRAGKTASAWVEFKEASAQAKRDGDDREGFARDRAAEMEKTLSRLTIKLSPNAGMSGLVVKRDGEVVDPALFGSGAPVDPGSHVVEATAPDHTPWSSKVVVGDSATVTVEVPVLGQPTHYTEPVATPAKSTTATPAATAAAPQAEEPADPGKSRRILGLAVGAGGVAAIAVGLVFGAKASSKKSDAHDGHCNDNNVCDSVGVDLIKSAQSAATLSTIFVGVGVAAVAGGVVLYLTAPKTAEAHALRVTPVVGPGVFAVSVAGSL
jgi:hypothetical protein